MSVKWKPNLYYTSLVLPTRRGFQQLSLTLRSRLGERKSILLAMYCIMAASILIVPYLIDLTSTAPSFAVEQPNTSQLFTFDTAHNATLTLPVPIPTYEVYKIPETDLSLHLTLLQTLDRLAMQSCLQTASIWVAYQTQSATIPDLGFEWKDTAGAVFYIRSLSQRLTWADLKNILRGLKEDLEDERRYFTTSFTVEQTSTQLFIAQGRLSRYKLPKPTSFSTAYQAVS